MVTGGGHDREPPAARGRHSRSRSRRDSAVSSDNSFFNAASTPEPPSPSFNEGGLRSLGETIDLHHGLPKRRRRRRLRWTLAILAAVIVMGAGSVGGYLWYLNDQVTRIKVGGLTQAPNKGVNSNSENILLVGSTSRCALSVQNRAYGICQDGVNGVNSDVVMILHLNATTHDVSILSIPRDLFIPNARRGGANKIDAALYQGPTQLVHAIEDDFAIPIQHYVELNFDSFANVVNDLGGINMYFPEEVYDAYSQLHITQTGCVHLNGYEALQVVRARHLQYKGPGVTTNYAPDWPQEAQSDLARIRRDHEFLRVLATAVAARGLSNPVTDTGLISSMAGQLTVDNGLGISAMVNLILTFHGVNPSAAPQYTLPVSVDQFGDYVYHGGDYGDIEFPAEPNDRNVVERFLGVGANADTLEGGNLPSPNDITVSVLNGTGVTNQAAQTASALAALGFQTVGVGDSPVVAQEEETLIDFAKRTPQDMAAAQAVADQIQGASIMAYGPTVDGAQVTVVTGTNFSINAPKGSTTTAPSAPSTTTTTSASNSSSALFAPPTPSVEQLAPWDPRSCTPSGGEGT